MEAAAVFVKRIGYEFTVAACRNTQGTTTSATIGIVLSCGFCFPLSVMPLFV